MIELVFGSWGGPDRDTRRKDARAAIAASRSYTEALRRLGMRVAGGNFRTIRRYVEAWEIPVDHFDPDAVRRAVPRRPPVPLEQVLLLA